jgi:hypothetical protein
MESEGCNVHNFDKQFILVEYPGVVENVDKAIRTLGGLENISTVSYKIGNCISSHEGHQLPLVKC